MSKIRREYLLCYDIGETKKRNKIFESLKDYGMFPIQKSVFWGEINIAEKRSIQRIIEETKLGDLDRVLFLPVDLLREQKIYMKGYDPEDFMEKKFGIL